MKGIPIKFRAKLCSTGEYVYSSQVRQYEKDLSQGYIDSERVCNICQLVGYDAAGDEIYEGDTLIDESGEEGTAYLDFVVDTEGKHGASYIEFGEKMYYWYKK